MGLFSDKYTGSMSGVSKKGKPISVSKNPKRPALGITEAMINAVGSMSSGIKKKPVRKSNVRKPRGF